MSSGVPVRTVRYPWGDVPYEWAAGYDNSVMFQTEVDCYRGLFHLHVLEAGDDPTWAQAVKGPERQKWMDAKEDEMGACGTLASSSSPQPTRCRSAKTSTTPCSMQEEAR